MRSRFLFLLFFTQLAAAQQTIDDYSIVLQPVSTDNLMGLQSYSFVQHDGKVLFIGGRLDGLHRRQPWASFDAAGHNDQLVLLDMQTHRVWKAQLSRLAPNLRDQLKSTNMCFAQHGEQAVILGGYGISETAGDHITFPYITTFHIPTVMAAVQQNAVQQQLFFQQENQLMAVTGGQLQVLNDVFYLVGGHRFDGRYNPNDGPSFTQSYTSSVVRFTLDETTSELTMLLAFQNEELLHRRDFNLVLQQNATGENYFTAFSGVFREDADLPFLSCAHIDADGVLEQADFRQFYNHYHCPDLGIYDRTAREMPTFFFGGIAQYYDSSGVLVQDDNVPFTKAISRVTREADGSMSEYRLPVEMPLLLGAGAEFIPAYTGDHRTTIFELQDSSGDSILLGYILGGIASSEKNIFWVNEGNESAAYNGLLAVRMVQQPVAAVENTCATSPLNVRIEKDSKTKRCYIDYTMPEDGETVTVSWTSENGRQFVSKPKKVSRGEHSFSRLLPRKKGVYRISVAIRGAKSYSWEQYFLLE